MRWTLRKKESELESEERLGSHGKTALATLITCLLLVSALSISFLNSASGNDASGAGTGDDLSSGNGTMGNDQFPPPLICMANPPPMIGYNNTSPPPRPPPPPNGTGTSPGPSSYTVVEPRFVWLDVNATQHLTAQAYDADNQSISGLTYNWTVETLTPPNPPLNANDTIPTVDTIDENGLFTATANGVACITVVTDYDGEHIVGHAVVLVGNPPPPRQHDSGPQPPCPPPSGDLNQPPRHPPRGGEGNPPPQQPCPGTRSPPPGI
jgi:hypothetical protein